jgi:hypothetical protein
VTHQTASPNSPRARVLALCGVIIKREDSVLEPTCPVCREIVDRNADYHNADRDR